MKKIFNSFVIVAMMAAAATTSSCTKTCDAGYEGSDCKTEIRAKFVGQFRGPETCSTGSDNYTVTVAKASDVLKISFSNVYNQNYTATATVSGSSFTVENQTVATGVTVSGTGTISGTNNNTLTFTYSISGAANNTCTFTGTKI